MCEIVMGREEGGRAERGRLTIEEGEEDGKRRRQEGQSRERLKMEDCEVQKK
jgi:hypothetical protein